MNIAYKITELKQDLTKGLLSNEEIFQRHIVDGSTYFFNDVIRDNLKEYTTKSIIANAFDVHIHEVVFVGSAKLGYSLNPKNLFNPFDLKFTNTKANRDKSDLDIAIVSSKLFDKIGDSIFDYTDSYTSKWKANEYYSEMEAQKKFDVPVCYKHFEYYAKGWFRPDFKPTGFDFCEKGTYQELKRLLFSQYKRKIAIAIYKNWHFFKEYHMRNLKSLHYLVKTEPL